ncbi:winged helix-turn-helix transcriptional regulator [Actinokineospora soli]|uniref:Winged helix-turn-helix transcriptional regulator n=1 Tax=Actinokineospora soli TaxID=1048753 RepID=A0ABW2TMD4_9PSEU
MRTYGQYCPIVRAVELLGDRWTLLIVRDMLTGATRFNELARGLPGLSRPLLSRRLRQLGKAGVLTRDGGGYHLTRAGQDLKPLVFGLADWGARHAFGDPRPDELDPEVLLWWMHRRIDTDELAGRAVLQVDITDRPKKYWLVMEPTGVSLCFTDPGFDVDAVLTADIATLYRAWEGEIDLLGAMHDGRVTLTGTAWLVRALPRWLLLSPIAPNVRAVRA